MPAIRERVSHVAVQIAARYAAPFKSRIRQFGQLVVLGGRRIVIVAVAYEANTPEKELTYSSA